MIFFDTSVLVAATQPNDPRQAACIAQLAIADRDGGAYALLMACARKINASRIYTLNGKDFRRVAPDLTARILEP